MIVLAALDYRWLEHASAVLYVGIILALLAMFSGIGSSALGATRWMQIGGVQIQPSAFATLVLIVTVATFCARRPEGLDRHDLFKVLALAAVPIVLVVKQPDLGSGIVMSVVLLVMLVMAGIPNRYLLLLVLLAVIGAFAVVHFELLKAYQLNRITAFFHSGKNLQSTGYNVQQSVAAIGSGGSGARDCSTGRRPISRTSPSSRPTSSSRPWANSSVSSARPACSLLLGIVSWRLLRSAQLARDAFGRLLATGCFTLIAFSVFENAGMAMGIMPVAGIPLPFLSYGGSATVAFFSAVGIALSVQLRAQR